MTFSMWRHRSLFAIAALACVPLRATAQSTSADAISPGQLAPTISDSAMVLHWWHGAIAAGGLSVLMALDQPVQSYAVDHQSESKDNLANALRHFGQPEVWLTTAAGMVGGGLLFHDPDLARAGGRVSLALGIAAVGAGGAKMLFGRPRPEQSLDADGYQPFSGQESFPSGHTAMAFALATSLSDEIHNTWATVGLYTVAAGVGWSRIYDNQHWLSDVGAGAMLGYTSAKLANGHWRIFNLHPPSLIMTPHGAGLGYQATF